LARSVKPRTSMSPFVRLVAMVLAVLVTAGDDRWWLVWSGRQPSDVGVGVVASSSPGVPVWWSGAGGIANRVSVQSQEPPCTSDRANLAVWTLVIESPVWGRGRRPARLESIAWRPRPEATTVASAGLPQSSYQVAGCCAGSWLRWLGLGEVRSERCCGRSSVGRVSPQRGLKTCRWVRGRAWRSTVDDEDGNAVAWEC
jgi:hypothetical protein